MADIGHCWTQVLRPERLSPVDQQTGDGVEAPAPQILHRTSPTIKAPMRCTWPTSFAAALLTTVCSAAYPDTVANFAADFSTASASSGAWQYGWTATLGGSFTQSAASTWYGTGNQVLLWSPAGTFWPSVGLNTSAVEAHIGAGTHMDGRADLERPLRWKHSEAQVDGLLGAGARGHDHMDVDARRVLLTVERDTRHLGAPQDAVPGDDQGGNARTRQCSRVDACLAIGIEHVVVLRTPARSDGPRSRRHRVVTPPRLRGVQRSVRRTSARAPWCACSA